MCWYAEHKWDRCGVHHNILSKPLRSEWIRVVWVMWIRQSLAGPVKKLCVWLSRAHREKNASAEEPYTLLHVNQKDEWMCVNIFITQGDRCIFTPTHCMRPQAVTDVVHLWCFIKIKIWEFIHTEMPWHCILSNTW